MGKHVPGSLATNYATLWAEVPQVPTCPSFVQLKIRSLASPLATLPNHGLRERALRGFRLYDKSCHL